MDTQSAFEDIVGFKILQPKKFMLENFMTSPKHAMLLIGCNGPQGDWQVENSWGETDPKHKYSTMSNVWFEHYVDEIIVHKKFLPFKLRTLYYKMLKKGNVTFLPFWDVFGTVANFRKALQAAGKRHIK
jgi:aminopeptidase C